MINKTNYSDKNRKIGVFSFKPSRAVNIANGIIIGVLAVTALVLYNTDRLNIVSLAAFFIGLMLISIDLEDKLGLLRMKKDCVLNRAEIVASIPCGDSAAETYENLLDYGKKEPANIFTSEMRRVGEFMDVYINPKTGEVMEKFFFEARARETKKCGVLIAGIAIVLAAIILEILRKLYGSPEMKTLLAAVLLLAVSLSASVWYFTRYAKMKREIGSAVFYACGMIKDYEQKESMNVEGIPVYEYYPTISYWHDGEKTYYSPTGYNRKKYPVGSEIDLYMDDNGNFFEAKSMKKTLGGGILSLVISVHVILAMVFLYIIR